MTIKEKYENVDNYKFVDKKSKGLRPRRRKVTMEDLFDDEAIIVDDEINEDLGTDIKNSKSNKLAFVSKANTKDMKKTIDDLTKKKITSIVVDNVNESDGGCGCGGGKKDLTEADIVGRRSLPGVGGAAPGVTLTNSVGKSNGRINKDAYEDSMKKVSKYNDIKLKQPMIDNGGVIKTATSDNDKYTKKFPVKNEEDYIDRMARTGSGMESLDYDVDPSDEWKDRFNKNLDGDKSFMSKLTKKRSEIRKNTPVYNIFPKDGTIGDQVNVFMGGDKNNKNVEKMNRERKMKESVSSIVDRIVAEAIAINESRDKEEIDIDTVEDILKERGWGDLGYENYVDFEKSDYFTGTSNSEKYAKEMSRYLKDLSSGVIDESEKIGKKESKKDFLSKIVGKKKSVKKEVKKKEVKKREVKESQGWITIIDNNDMKDIMSTPQPKVERPSANMGISTGFGSINLGSLRVENAENLDKVVIPEEYQIEGFVFDITDNNRTAKVRFEEGELIVLTDKNKSMINEESNRIMKLMNYKYDEKSPSKSVMKEDVNQTLKKMLNDVKGLSRG
jgi:hypothetical protein